MLRRGAGADRARARSCNRSVRTFLLIAARAKALATLTASGGDALLIEKDGSIVGLFGYREGTRCLRR